MSIKFNEKSAIKLIIILLAASITIGFLNITILYALLAVELVLISVFFARKFMGKISLLQFLWIVSTVYIILNSRTFDYNLLFYLLNSILGLMVLICIPKESCLVIYNQFKIFAVLGLISGITILFELIPPNFIIPIFQRLAPDDLVDIHSFLRNGRYLGITNYVWYTSLLLFLGGGYILSVQKDSTKKQKIFNLVILAVLFTASFLSGSRSSMLVFPFVAVLFYGGKKTIRNVILALGVLYLLYLFIMYSNLSLRIIDKFQILINKVKEGAIIDDTRNQLREVAIADFKSNWLFGIGWYEFRYHTHSLFNKYLHTHNLYLQLIAENGIFGTIIITLPWLATYIKAVSYFFKYRNYSENKTYKIVKYFLMILTLLFIDSFVHVTLFDPRTMLIFYIICGVVMQLTKTAPDPNPIPDNQLTEVRG